MKTRRRLCSGNTLKCTGVDRGRERNVGDARKRVNVRNVVAGDVMRVPVDALRLLSSVFCVMWVTLIVVLFEDARASLSVHKYSTRVVRTKYGPLRGVMIHIHPPVEAFLGVPYATPPVGSLR